MGENKLPNKLPNKVTASFLHKPAYILIFLKFNLVGFRKCWAQIDTESKNKIAFAVDNIPVPYDSAPKNSLMQNTKIPPK